MKLLKKTKISCAVCIAMAAAVEAPLALAQVEATEQTEPEAQSKSRIEQIEVTASRRVQNIQTVPISVSALSAKALEENNISKFEDYIEMIPSASAGGRGPGQSDVYIRGLALGHNGITGTEFTPAPTVGLYLDEQPVSATGRNLDVYVTDVERLEVLAGPQGTLFGASAQAGAIRIITNKPDASGFSAGFEVDYGQTKGGDDSTSLEGFVNIPIIEEELAVRITAYNDKQGGYIDNVYDTFTLDPTINENANPDFFNNGDVTQGIEDQWLDATFTEIDNEEYVEKDFNDSEYLGVRLGVKWDPSEDFSVLIQHTHQDLDVDGVFDYDPTLGDLKVSRFADDVLEDSFDLTSWSLEARLDFLDIVYTGGYLDRDIYQVVDYIGYNNSGAFASDYYTCTYYTAVRECLDPSKRFVGEVTNERLTHELRFSTPYDKPVRAVVGLFYDDQTITHDGEYDYAAAPDLGFFQNRPIVGSTANDPDFREPGVTFINDLTRDEKQKAIFGELAWDITDKLTATFGARYYELEATFLGSSSFANTSTWGATEDYTDYGRNYDTSLADISPLKQDGTITKLTLGYQHDKNTLIYATMSEGYRAGGFNRLSGDAINSNNLPEFEDFSVPATYESDEVTNFELGWKTRLLDGDLTFNGAVYKIFWDNIQVAILDTVNILQLTFTDNVADAEILGIEMDVAWSATDNLTLFAAVSNNHSEVTKLVSGLDFTFAPEGSQLALSPELNYSIRGRYDWTVDSVDAYGQVTMQYTDDSYSSMYTATREKQDNYTLVNASLGAQFDEWGVELYIDNLTDELAEKYINTIDDIRRITTNRPRTIGLRVNYKYY
ncbi:TonB-dependent receptor [uncultured Paraglaciecola sp.]|uniref:TonB-dependent receptor n=1 Tax=uncultured Paraglaciecola sp. TaxID=1765024 RepID=UPI0025924466|nr:TonB-dependent receptor [uncultured Paraglaciecola sp.]